MGKTKNMADMETAMRQARESAERIRRAEIMKKIDELEKEKAICESCVSELSGVVSGLNGKQSDLNSAFMNFSQNDLTGQIAIPGIFDGLGAIAVKGLVNESVEQMNAVAGDIINIIGTIDSQIGQLQEYIGQLEEKVYNLKVML
ncbi:MAG: hypothetical protein ACI4DK_04345 [Lachnospiraceae bacterium]